MGDFHSAGVTRLCPALWLWSARKIGVPRTGWPGFEVAGETKAETIPVFAPARRQGGRIVPARSEEIFHQHFVIFDAINDNLPGQPSTLSESQPAIERLGTDVRRAYLNREFLISLFACECLRRIP